MLSRFVTERKLGLVNVNAMQIRINSTQARFLLQKSTTFAVLCTLHEAGSQFKHAPLAKVLFQNFAAHPALV